MESIRKEQAATNATSIKSIVNPIIQLKSASPKVISQVIQKGSQHDKLDTILEMITKEKAITETKKEKKDWKIPFKWKKTFN